MKNEDQQINEIKQKIVDKILHEMHQRKLNQSKLAEILGIDQPKISRLSKGKFQSFSLFRLLSFLNLLDYDVKISVRANTDQSKGTIKII